MTEQRKPSLTLPIVIAISGILSSFLGWGFVLKERRDDSTRSIERAAISARRAVGMQVEAQVNSLRGLASLWDQFGAGPDPQWRFGTRQVMQQARGVEWIAWLDRDGLEDRFASVNPAFQLEPAVRTRAFSLSSDKVVDGPIALKEKESLRYWIVLPIGKPSGDVLVASVSAEESLRSIFLDYSPEYAVTVHWGSSRLFQHGEPMPKRPAWWQAVEAIPFSFDETWTVTLQPSEQLARSVQTALPAYLLATGILLSLVLGLLVHQANLARARERSLAASNRALLARIYEASAQDLRLQALNQELETRVQERTAELGAAVEELRAFNYSVSHDLRSPLGAILSFAALLKEDYADRLDATGTDWLARIGRSAESALDLLDGFLQLSRVSRVGLEADTVDMESLAQRAFAESRESENAPRAILRLGQLPDAYGDRRLLGTVLVNLFRNAIKYSRPRTDRIVEFRGEVSEDGKEVVYCVEDFGVGFDMKHERKLFGLFERLHTAEEFEGTGVGLAIVARIIRRHGGRVWADGETGKGARFYFALPWKGDRSTCVDRQPSSSSTTIATT